MTKKELEKKLAAHRDELQKMGVLSLAVFGSVARNESTPKSDIDLLVEFDRDVGLFHQKTKKVDGFLDGPHYSALDKGGRFLYSAYKIC